LLSADIARPESLSSIFGRSQGRAARHFRDKAKNHFAVRLFATDSIDITLEILLPPTRGWHGTGRERKRVLVFAL